MKRVYGGVVINESGRVLLRKPKGLHKTRIWTFAKGKQEEGESAEQTALREVQEETGIRGKILRRLSSAREEPAPHGEYFLMAPIEDTGKFDDETLAIVWATRVEAEELIAMTEDPERRVRDLKLLQLAFELFGSVRGLLPFSFPRDNGLV